MPLYYIREIDEKSVVDLDHYVLLYTKARDLLTYIYAYGFLIDRVYIECYSRKRDYQQVFIHNNKIEIGTFKPVSFLDEFVQYAKKLGGF